MDRAQLLQEAEGFRQQRKWKQAQDCYDKLILDDPYDGQAYFYSGLTYFSANQPDKAKRRYEQAIAMNPEDGHAIYMMGMIYSDRENFEQAETHLLKAAELLPSNASVCRNIGVLYRKYGQFGKADQYYQKAISLDPGDYLNYFNRSLLFRNTGRFEEAIAILEEARRIAPNEGRIGNQMASIYLKMGKVAEAERAYLQSIQLEPGNAEYIYNYGTLLKDNALYHKAIMCFRAAIERQPQIAMAYSSLGFLLYYQGNGVEDKEEAEKLYLRSVAIDPQHSTCHNHLGVVYLNRKEYGKALEYFHKCIKTDSSYLIGYTNLANAYAGLQDFDQAEYYCREALKIDPMAVEAYRVLAEIEVIMKANYVKGMELCRRVLALENDNLHVHRLLCQIPAAFNEDKDHHYYRMVYLAEKQLNYSFRKFELEYAFKLDAPYLVKRLLHVLPAGIWENFSSFSSQIQECLGQLTHFDMLIDKWRAEKKEPLKALKAEAIVKFYLGDPLAAYQIFDDEIEREGGELDLQGQYYFCLSAFSTLNEAAAILDYAVKQADEATRDITALSSIESYYAANIYFLAQQYEQAISLLESISADFPAADYKLAEIYSAVEGIGYPERFKQTIAAIKLRESQLPYFQFGLDAVDADMEESQFLESIRDVVCFNENIHIAGHIFPQDLELKRPFYNLVKLDEADVKKDRLSLRQSLNDAWHQYILGDIDPEEYKEHYNAVLSFRDPAQRLGELIEQGAKAELFDLLENHRDKFYFNFKLYLSVNYQLYQDKHISLERADCINAYMYECMNNLPAFKNSSTQAFLLKSARDIFIVDSIPYLSYMERLKQLWENIQLDQKGKASPIIPFSRFSVIYAGAMQPEAS